MDSDIAGFDDNGADLGDFADREVGAEEDEVPFQGHQPEHPKLPPDWN